MVSPYLSTIGDLLTITGARAAVKAFFPFSYYYAFCPVEIRERMKQGPASATIGVPAAYTPVVIEHIGDVDHSGRAGQFHRIPLCLGQTLGTLLQILHFMTGLYFPTRKTLGDAFRGKGSTAQGVDFKIVPLQRYAKLSQALPTDRTAGGQQQVWNRVTFSGKRRAIIGDAMADYYKKRKTQTGAAAGVSNLFANLSAYKNSILHHTMRDSFIDKGVVEWRSTEGLSFTEHGAVVDRPVDVVPVLFLGTDLPIIAEADPLDYPA
ncbi:hypothetical protein J6590_101784 [Homalodisca vitripennis]|nr:hypothetical protein J6590_086703 [Homalodisca vitripennis]KAG8318958.1 hypothetical protein J6590_101784 [Homalodisca vitripennis]